MSIILDTLRKGRGRQTAGPNPNAAQTDAVLHTLGYGRFNPATPFNRLKRVLAYLAFGIILAILLWVTVLWLTRAFSSSTSTRESAVPQAEQLRPMPAERPMLPVEAAPGSAAPAVHAAPSEPTVAQLPAVPDRATGTPPARASAPSSVSGAVSGTDRRVVRRSPPVSVADSMPKAPAGAPSRTALSTAAAPNVATVTTGDDHFGRAMMYQRLGDFENALVSYRQVLQRDDLNVEAHNNLGILYRDKGLFDDAIRHFQRAIAINPGYARARNNLGVVYLNQRKLEMAATQFHAALAIDSKNVESMVNLSTLEKESGHRDEARRWLSRALAINSRSAEGRYNLGLLEDEAGNRTEALTQYRAFLQYGAASHPTLVAEVRKRVDALEGK